MKPGAPDEMLEALTAVQRSLVDAGASGMLIGGLAAIVHGVPRLTRDIDVTVGGAGLDLERLSRVLNENGIAPRIDDAVEFARKHQVLLARHRDSGVDIDITIAWLPFEQEALRAARPVEIGTVMLPVVRPEDLVVYKLVAWRPQDRQDVERLLTRFGTEMNLGRVRRLLEEFAAVLGAKERIDELDRLIARFVRT